MTPNQLESAIIDVIEEAGLKVNDQTLAAISRVVQAVEADPRNALDDDD